MTATLPQTTVSSQDASDEGERQKNDVPAFDVTKFLAPGQEWAFSTLVKVFPDIGEAFAQRKFAEAFGLMEHSNGWLANGFTVGSLAICMWNQIPQRIWPH